MSWNRLSGLFYSNRLISQKQQIYSITGELTARNLPERELNNQQIKEALKRLQDFLGILEDNRPATQGSEDWHFTLKLWFPKWDTIANLRRFEEEWERLRPLRSRQVTGENSDSLVTESTPSLSFVKLNSSNFQDWGEALDVSTFYGRTEELAALEQWIVTDRCRLVALLGMGGIGKTALSIKLAERVQDKFEYLIWRSLRNAPPIQELLADLIKFLSHQQVTELAENTDGKLSQLIECIRASRCLLILDNVESVLSSDHTPDVNLSHRVGAYRPGYEGYGQLLRCIGETQHQSCLMLTSREKPRGIGTKEGIAQPIRSYQLVGLKPVEGTAVLQEKGFLVPEVQAQALIANYAGNPLALKIVATTIQELFDGDVALFLEQGTVIFGDISDLLEQQFKRLSSVEKQIMHWLAINREWVSLTELQSDIVPPASYRTLLEALESLQHRSLVERQSSSFSQQPVVMEYVIDCFIDQICREACASEIVLFNSHALMKAQSKDFLRDAQIRLIIQPIAEHLVGLLGTKREVEKCLVQLLSMLKASTPRKPGYAAGNIFNLLRQLQIDISGYDFSNLAVWQVSFQGVNLHHVNFAGADLTQSVFTQTIGSIWSATFSSNGVLLATGIDSDICLWQVADGKQLMAFMGHTAWVVSVAIISRPASLNETATTIANPSANGEEEILASGSHDQTVRLWNVQTGQCLKTLRGHTSWVQSVTFSPDGQLLASGSNDQTIRLWNVVTGQCLKVLIGHTDLVLWISFTPDGRSLISASDDKTVRCWDTVTGECLRVLKISINWRLAIALSPDGRTLATGSEGKTVKLWDLETGSWKHTLEGYDSWVWSVAFSQDSQRFATGAEDKTIKIWDVHTGECLNTIQDHLHRVWLVKFSPDDQALVSVSEDQSVRLWDASTSHCLKTLKAYSNSVFCVAFSPDGQLLASGSEDQHVRLRHVETGECCKLLQGHTNFVDTVAFSPSNLWLATGSDDRTIKIWDIHSSECLRTFWGHTSWVQSISYSPNGQVLASGSHDHTVKLWDVYTGKCLHTLEGHIHRVKSVRYSPQGTTLASGSDDKTVKLWDVSTGICLQTLQGHADWVLWVAFSPEGDLLASGSGDQTIKIWNVHTGECVQTLEGHTQRVRCVAFSGDRVTFPLEEHKASSADRTLVASASDDQFIKLWNIQTGQCMMTLEGHTKAIWSIEFSNDAQTLVSSSEDETIKLWNIQTGECIRTMRVNRPYERMNITGAVGLTTAQKTTLKALGAVEL